MKKRISICFIISFFAVFSLTAQVYEYKIVTSVESIIPNGLGRSRIIDSNESKDYKSFTTKQSDSEDNTRNKSKRDKIRVKNYDETKILNFFNIGGIRFQNIAANDSVIASKINDLAAQGWELTFVSTGVESYSGNPDVNGMFITRYVFKRLKK